LRRKNFNLPTVYANAMMVARYIPGIMPVIYDDVEPEGAIAPTEGRLKEAIARMRVLPHRPN
jgi:hypothetical protein